MGSTMNCLGTRRRRLVGGEDFSRLTQAILDNSFDGVRGTQHAPRGPCRLLESVHGLAEIVERSGGVPKKVGKKKGVPKE